MDPHGTNDIKLEPIAKRAIAVSSLPKESKTMEKQLKTQIGVA
jgi:hypothetical protein